MHHTTPLQAPFLPLRQTLCPFTHKTAQDAAALIDLHLPSDAAYHLTQIWNGLRYCYSKYPARLSTTYTPLVNRVTFLSPNFMMVHLAPIQSGTSKCAHKVLSIEEKENPPPGFSPIVIRVQAFIQLHSLCPDHISQFFHELDVIHSIRSPHVISPPKSVIIDSKGYHGYFMTLAPFDLMTVLQQFVKIEEDHATIQRVELLMCIFLNCAWGVMDIHNQG